MSSRGPVGGCRIDQAPAEPSARSHSAEIRNAAGRSHRSQFLLVRAAQIRAPRWRNGVVVATLVSARLWRASGALISPGPNRSFRELSLAGSVDPDIWCPPTFVGNSGIECFNGDRGFALSFLTRHDRSLVVPAQAGSQSS